MHPHVFISMKVECISERLFVSCVKNNCFRECSAKTASLKIKGMATYFLPSPNPILAGEPCAFGHPFFSNCYYWLVDQKL